MQEDYSAAVQVYDTLRTRNPESPDVLLLQNYVEFLLRLRGMMEELETYAQEWELTDEEREQYRSIRGEWEREARRVFDHISD